MRGQDDSGIGADGAFYEALNARIGSELAAEIRRKGQIGPKAPFGNWRLSSFG